MTKNLDRLDYYLRELYQINKTLEALRNQLTVSSNPYETKFLEEDIEELIQQKKNCIRNFNEENPPSQNQEKKPLPIKTTPKSLKNNCTKQSYSPPKLSL